MPSPRPPYIPWFTRKPLISRSNQIFSALIRHGYGWLVTSLEAGLEKSRLGERRFFRQDGQTRANEFVSALIELGPTFIKFGQALGARSDLLPPEYIEALNRLQDEVPPVPFETIHEVLTAELGKDPFEIFAALEREPLASASIGQVYAARLWSGEEVVVKVVRPQAQEMFEQDLEILFDMADWASEHTKLGKTYNLPLLVEEFAHTVLAEFDYIREGRNADTFRENFAGDTDIYIPYVYWEHTSHHVITMERVYGLKINDLAGLKAAGIDCRKVAENLMHFALFQIFDFGLYHADPHAGNFFVQPDASLAVVDFGMVGRFNPQLKRSFLNMASAIDQNDAPILVDELLSSGIYSSGIDRRALTRDIERLLEKFSSTAIQDISAARAFNELFAIVLRHGLQLPGELVAMTRAISISEGTGTALYPEFRLLEFAAPTMRQFWTEERSPSVMLPRMGKAALDTLELSIDLPRRVHRLLGQIERGQMEVSLNRQEIHDLIGKLQTMTNRMTLGMILAAVIIALSLVMVVYRAEAWQALGNYIFGFALFSSIIFGVWLIWSIIRSGRT